jgi:peptidoglycan/xylan/chitin deacetylase (PgdA/CDA1 family)
VSTSSPIAQVALTFDDGPHPDSTPALLDALLEAGQRATFFVCGNQVDAHPGLLRAVQAAGMWIGNHSFTHAHLTGLTTGGIAEEITRTQEAVASVTGVLPVLFRPPYGETDARVRAAAAAVGLTEEFWTVDTRDWAGVDADGIVAAAGTVEPGGTVLMHDGGYRTTVDAVPRILRALACRGLQPGPVPRP